MPYRRLPTTDKARLRALEKCQKQITSVKPEERAVSEHLATELKVFLPRFQQSIINLEAAKNNQVDKNKQYIYLQRKARLYVSHYIQVMNMAISRGELKPEIREFYDLYSYGNTVPPLNAEKDLLEWGKKVIEGDKKRIQNGGSPIYNPSIALVKVNYEKYTEVYHFQKTLQTTTDRSSQQVNNLRNEADKLIQNIWNEVEQKFQPLHNGRNRALSEEYGVVYVYRKSEKKKLEAMQLQPEFNF
ncbi:MAG: hypothetical protein PF486_14950 [Prolixibacteraceae bacterium]|jgi:hypothetical protein|nr:hypothetical protein [Prolixibacteraceae bacterium]